jgi:hypothetical protein
MLPSHFCSTCDLRVLHAYRAKKSFIDDDTDDDTRLRTNNNQPLTASRCCCLFCCSSSHQPSMCKNNQHPAAVYFSLGKLRFGHHGIIATLALIVTIIAYATVHIPTIVCSMILTALTALDARSLMSQVPIRSIIVPGVSAPHREAFKRTMSMMHYANVRIFGELCRGTADTSALTLYQTSYKTLLLYMWTQFLPIHSPLDNGNTFIFVVPMFVGVSLDIYQTLALETSINVTHYLLLQLSALVIAFYFTLAFRGYFSVRQIYIASALMVAGIFGSGIFMIVAPPPSS